MAAPYLTAQNLSLKFGQAELFNNLGFAIHPGERWAIIGPNGAGKSSLLKIFGRVLKPDAGTVSIRNNIAVTLVTQKFDCSPEETVWTILRSSLPERFDIDKKRDDVEAELLAQYAMLETNPDIFEDPDWQEKLEKLQETQGQISGASSVNILESALKVARLEELRDRPHETLSGGQQKRLQLVSALLTDPDLILLDEPTNHLDVETVEWLEDFLLNLASDGNGLLGSLRRREEPVAYIVVSHDRSLIDTLANNILEIEFGRNETYEGNYEDYLVAKAGREQTAENERLRVKNTFRKELAWLRAGTKARTTKQTARIDRAKKLGTNLADRNKRANETKAVELGFNADITRMARNDDDEMVLISRPMGKQELLATNNLSLPFPGGGKLLIKDFDFSLKAGMRVALMGPNGCGKTTLLKALADKVSPQIKHHELVEIGFFDQKREALNGQDTIKEVVCPKGEFVEWGKKPIHVNSYLGKFLFRREDLLRQVKDLSGGEHARLLLAQMMLQSNNLLIMDEPTNDLDITTLQLLEGNLQQFTGAVLFTSHDRYFLKKVATHFLTFLGTEEVKGEKFGRWMLLADLDQSIAAIDEFNAKKFFTAKKESQKETPFASQDAASTASSKKLSFKEQKELETIEKRIAALEAILPAKAEELQKLYSKNASFEETKALAEEVLDLEKESAANYARWEKIMEKLN